MKQKRAKCVRTYIRMHMYNDWWMHACSPYSGEPILSTLSRRTHGQAPAHTCPHTHPSVSPSFSTVPPLSVIPSKHTTHTHVYLLFTSMHPSTVKQSLPPPLPSPPPPTPTTFMTMMKISCTPAPVIRTIRLTLVPAREPATFDRGLTRRMAIPARYTSTPNTIPKTTMT